MREIRRRKVIKITGKIFAGPKAACDPNQVRYLAEELRSARESDPMCGMIVVLGGGNIPPGKEFAEGGGFSQEAADQMGIIATLINALALADMCEDVHLDTRILSEIPTPFIDGYRARLAEEALESEKVIIYVGGTGREKFSTDAAAALVAYQHSAKEIYKGTIVDGIFNRDPALAQQIGESPMLFERLSYTEAAFLKVFDRVTLARCEDGGISIRVFNITVPGNLKKAFSGAVGSLIE